MRYLHRRQLLKGALAGLSMASAVEQLRAESAGLVDARQHFQPGRPVTAITLGAGNRGNIYGGYAAAYPGQLNITGVAEPIAVRKQNYQAGHGILPDRCFDTWEQVFERPKMADAVIITTPDALHYGPAIAALEKGYHVLLEKPVSPTLEECLHIRDLALAKQRIVAVCHVLRYTDYFRELKRLIESGAVGELVSIQHLEPIQHEHMAHSFVRGNWHNSGTSTPIILAKSCHDLDMLRWLANRPAQKISAFGDLKWFRRDNAPRGSTARCLDGCAVERECPYSARKLYLEKEGWSYVFDLSEGTDRIAAKTELLATTDYGRCVYRMDNDQPDHYVANIQFADSVTASFAMEAFTAYHGRRTRIMGSMGDIVGDMRELTHTDFRTGEVTQWQAPSASSGHGGGDYGLMYDWVRAVSAGDASLLSSSIEVSIESHVMAFKAEQSRLQSTVESIST